MGKTAFLFAGQGAQQIGMGRDLAEQFPCAMQVFEEASDALGIDMKKLVWESDEATLKITENTQPAILTMSIAALRVLEEAGVQADLCAGLKMCIRDRRGAVRTPQSADAFSGGDRVAEAPPRKAV